MTESAYFRVLGTRDELAAIGVEEFQVDLPIGSHSCEICRAMDGRIFPMSEFAVGLNAPPFHPNCENGSIIPVMDEDFEEVLGEARGEKVEQGLTNGGESGIIHSEGDNVALEYQRYGRNKDTIVNKSYINGGKYRRKYDSISDNADVNKAVYESAKKALKHRSGTLYEDMYWIDSDSGKVVASELSSTIEQQIVYSEATRKVVSSYEKKKLIAIHSHPSSMPPSVSDFNSCCHNKYKMGYVACHDGKVFAYTSDEEISENLYNLNISSFMDDGMTEYEAQIATLNKLKENYLIDFWEVT